MRRRSEKDEADVCPNCPARSDAARSIEIAPGVWLPRLGLGVWEVDPGSTGERIIAGALEAGYRHIDTAQGYENERAVGAGIRASGVPREEIFVTTKFFPGRADAEREAERSLEKLGLDHMDLYLIHDPRRDPTWAWPAMERVHARGLARAIGVSNFAPPTSTRCSRLRPSRPPSTSCSSTRSPTGSASSRRAARGTSRSRRTAR